MSDYLEKLEKHFEEHPENKLNIPVEVYAFEVSPNEIQKLCSGTYINYLDYNDIDVLDVIIGNAGKNYELTNDESNKLIQYSMDNTFDSSFYKNGEIIKIVIDEEGMEFLKDKDNRTMSDVASYSSIDDYCSDDIDLGGR